MKPTDTTSDTRYRVFRVFRGGGWDYDGPSWVRAASLSTYEPADRNSHIGFRCALRGRSPRV